MIDNKMPIIAGVGAGGITLGESIQDVVLKFPNVFIKKKQFDDDKTGLWGSKNIDLWVENNSRVNQIRVKNNYQGLLLTTISLGDTVDKLESTLGKLILDANDDLVIRDLKGICFEYDLNSKVLTEMYIYDSSLYDLLPESFYQLGS